MGWVGLGWFNLFHADYSPPIECSLINLSSSDFSTSHVPKPVTARSFPERIRCRIVVTGTPVISATSESRYVIRVGGFLGLFISICLVKDRHFAPSMEYFRWDFKVSQCVYIERITLGFYLNPSLCSSLPQWTIFELSLSFERRYSPNFEPIFF